MSPTDQKADATHDLRTLPMEQLEAEIGSTPDGLTQDEAGQRLTKYGHNELAEKEENPILKFLSYFWGPIPWMIEIAVILSALVGHWADFFIILVLLLANAIIGFWEEHQAGNAIAALKAKLAVRAKVRRNGDWTSVEARDIVPGDVIRVRLGDIVPADARLLEGDPVEVDQSALTGESLPVTRKSGEAIYSGAIVRQGEIDAMVYGTGANTYFGKTAQLVGEAHTVSHFQRAVLRIGNYLIVLAIALVALIIAVAVLRGDPLLETLQFALVLTVAAIPVAMPTVLSVTMAVGARLLGRDAGDRQPAGVDRGTGRNGRPVLRQDRHADPEQAQPRRSVQRRRRERADDVIVAAALASRSEDEDTIDMAVIGGVKDQTKLAGYKVTHFQPFDPVHKRTEAALTAADGSNSK